MTDTTVNQDATNSTAPVPTPAPEPTPSLADVAKEAVSAVESLVGIGGEILHAGSPGAMVATAFEHVDDAIDDVQKLANDLIDLERWLESRGTGIVDLLRTVAKQFHGVA